MHVSTLISHYSITSIYDIKGMFTKHMVVMLKYYLHVFHMQDFKVLLMSYIDLE